MDQWYYAETGGSIGPIEEDTLAGLIRTGRVRRDTPVWNPDMADWIHAGELAALREYFADAPDLPERPKLKVAALDSDYVVDPAGRLQPPSKEHFGGVSVTPQKSSWTPGSSDWTPFPQSNPAPQADVDPYDLVDYSRQEYVNQHRPWVRFSARSLDTLIVTILVGILLSLVAPKIILQSGKANNLILGLLAALALIPFEGWCLRMFGTTPSKWLHEIFIEGPNGGKPTFQQGMSRSFNVWLRGQALGIPVISFIANVYYFFRVNAGDETDWDKLGGFRVVHHEIGPKLIGIIFAWGALIFVYSKVQWGDFVMLSDAEKHEIRHESYVQWLEDQTGESIPAEEVGEMDNGEDVGMDELFDAAIGEEK